MLLIKRLPSLLLLTLLGTGIHGEETIRVATLNLWHSRTDLKERTVATAQTLKDLQPDVVGLQEVSGSIWRSNRARLLADSLDMHHVYRPSDGVKLVFEEGLAILSHSAIRHQTRTKLTHSKVWPFERRFVQWAEVRLPSGQPFLLLNTHFTHHDPVTYQLERLEQALDVIEVAATQALARDIPAVLVGDMNSIPSHLAMQALCGNLLGLDEPPFLDVWTHVGHGSGATYCPSNEYQDSTATSARLDYILVLRGTTYELRPQQAWKIGESSGPSLSDHYGLAADLTLHLRGEEGGSSLGHTMSKIRWEDSNGLPAKQRAHWLCQRVRHLRDTLKMIRDQMSQDPIYASAQGGRSRLLQVVQLNLAQRMVTPMASLTIPDLSHGFASVPPQFQLANDRP